jgi:hypothetical protein
MARSMASLPGGKRGENVADAGLTRCSLTVSMRPPNRFSYDQPSFSEEDLNRFRRRVDAPYRRRGCHEQTQGGAAGTVPQRNCNGLC